MSTLYLHENVRLKNVYYLSWKKTLYDWNVKWFLLTKMHRVGSGDCGGARRCDIGTFCTQIFAGFTGIFQRLSEANLISKKNLVEFGDFETPNRYVKLDSLWNHWMPSSRGNLYPCWQLLTRNGTVCIYYSINIYHI